MKCHCVARLAFSYTWAVFQIELLASGLPLSSESQSNAADKCLLDILRQDPATTPDTAPVITGWAPFRSAERLFHHNIDFAIEKAVKALSVGLDVPRGGIERELEGTYRHDWQIARSRMALTVTGWLRRMAHRKP